MFDHKWPGATPEGAGAKSQVLFLLVFVCLLCA